MLPSSSSGMFRTLLFWGLLVFLFSHDTSAASQKSSSCLPTVCTTAGIPGTPGKPGDPGFPGRDGRDGRDGLKGLDGSTGPKGSIGPVGLQGPVGPQGKTGPQGPPGTPGKAGDQGPPGTPGKAGDQGLPGTPGKAGDQGLPGTPGKTGTEVHPGQVPLVNWKECAWKDINDDKDNGKIKDCLFTKNHSDTTLHVYWDGVLRIYNCNNCCKRWYFTFNGAECSGPMPIDGIVYMLTGTKKNLHRHRHIEGHCQNIPKGRVRVGFWVGDCRGERSADAYTGWNSYSRIFVEEIPGPQN